MNPTLGLVERDLNAENKMKGKRRAVMSMGGKPVDDTLSPKSLARRTAVSLLPYLFSRCFSFSLGLSLPIKLIMEVGLMVETP
jgi:hypothetical protein